MPKPLLSLLVCLGIVLLGVLPLSPAVRGEPADPSSPAAGVGQRGEEPLVAALRAASDGDVRISYHAQTGRVRFIGASPEQPIHPPDTGAGGVAPQALGTAEPADVARAYLDSYGPLFGLADPTAEMALSSASETADRRSVLRFRQEWEGIPVFGGEMILQIDFLRRLLSAAGEVLPREDVALSPRIPAEVAARRALEVVAKGSPVPIEDLETTAPELWLYNPALVGAPGPQTTRLVWRLEVRSTDEPRSVRELVLADAESGAVALRFSLVRSALVRRVYDNENVRGLSLPGTNLVRQEGAPATGMSDADDAYDYAGDTYRFFESLGRDSIDDRGMALVSTVRYCPPGAPCPYPNAFWDGKQMAYGDRMVADDVVAHEMAHGVTDHEAGLFYYMQSGAISEGFSDAFGELVDLTNGAGNDAPEVRWLIGEDLPADLGFSVPLRSMKDPIALGDPDRLTSPHYVCGPTDYGGVHSNGGVMNKAVYLMTDGGTFNGQTVRGLGVDKVARILYEALTNHLTSAADYNDLSDALVQAATHLVGSHGITPGDADQVRRAALATEMHLQPTSCAAPEAAVCEAGQPTFLFADDMEDPSSGTWAAGSLDDGPSHWYYPQTTNPYTGWDMTYASSGQMNLWGDADFAGYWYGFASSYGASDSYIAMTRDVALPSNAYLHFRHSYAFEAGGGSYYDAGVVEFSTNGGTTWQDARLLFEEQGYDGVVDGTTGNPLAGRPAFVGESNGYLSSRLSLAPLAGRSVRFRFRVGTDESSGYYGWFVDDVAIYTCGSAVQPTVPPSDPGAQRLHLPLIAHRYRPGGTTILAREGFEGPFPAGGWALEGEPGGAYLWGRRDCRPGSGDHSAWAVGGGSSGSGLACGATYPSGVSSWLVYGPFSLADADEAAVDVRLWCNTDAGDHLSLMASVDGDSFYGVVLSGTSDGWVQHRLDLTAVHGLGDVTGRDAVWFAAIFDSDGATTLAEGAYLDDVMIWKRSRGLSAAAAAGRLPPSGLREVGSSRARPGAGS